MGDPYEKELLSKVGNLSASDVRFFLGIPAARRQGRAGKPSPALCVLEALRKLDYSMRLPEMPGPFGFFARLKEALGKKDDIDAIVTAMTRGVSKELESKLRRPLKDFFDLCEFTFRDHWRTSAAHFLSLYEKALWAEIFGIWTNDDARRLKEVNRSQKLKVSKKERSYQDGYLAQSVNRALTNLSRLDYLHAKRVPLGKSRSVKYYPGLALFNFLNDWAEMKVRVRRAQVDDVRSETGIVLVGTKNLRDAELETKIINDIRVAVLAVLSNWKKEKEKLGEKGLSKWKRDEAKLAGELVEKLKGFYLAEKSIQEELGNFEFPAVRLNERYRSRLPYIVLDLNRLPIFRFYVGLGSDKKSTKETVALKEQVTRELQSIASC
jgi:hypothetical protein